MTTTTDRLLALAADHRKKAEALEFAAEALNGHHTQKKQVIQPTVLKQAIKIRRQAKPVKQSAVKGAFVKTALEVLIDAKRPLSTAELRAGVEDRLGEKLSTGAGFSSLTRYGYAKKNRHGWTTTGKSSPA